MGRHRRSAKRAGRPVRTGLLGVSAAVAVGAVIVASGLLPGDDTSIVGGELARQAGAQRGIRPAADPGRHERRADARDILAVLVVFTDRARHDAPASEGAGEKPCSEAREARGAHCQAVDEGSGPEAGEARSREEREGEEGERPDPYGVALPDRAPDRQKPVSSSSEAAAEAEVLNLVNEERSKVGCSPVRTDAPLAKLAGTFSKDMANRGFFGHTDPEGDSPWDRAAQAGVNDLGAENIARGQADASAVMNSWMNSEGHRANILNCDYKTLGVGVHMADGGPWWTQDFGF